jgi:putative endonuclease
MYYMYVLQSPHGELYYGSTNDLKRRLAEHRSGVNTARKKAEWDLIYYEAYRAESDARNRERQIKLHGQAAAQLRRRISASRQTKS